MKRAEYMSDAIISLIETRKNYQKKKKKLLIYTLK